MNFGHNKENDKTQNIQLNVQLGYFSIFILSKHVNIKISKKNSKYLKQTKKISTVEICQFLYYQKNFNIKISTKKFNTSKKNQKKNHGRDL